MSLEDLTVSELKELLKERGLKVSGKKSELIDRLSSDDGNKPADEDPPKEEPETQSEEIIDEEDDDDGDDGDDDDGFYEEEGDFEEWDEFHTSRQKPVLDSATQSALDIRLMQKKKQPKFRRQEWFRYRRLSKTGYRKPKGKDSKMRMNRKYRSPMARVGYGKIGSARGLHPSGFEEVLVHNANDLDGLNPELQAVRVAAKVGNRKRSTIHERADNLGLRVLNRRPIDNRGDLR